MTDITCSECKTPDDFLNHCFTSYSTHSETYRVLKLYLYGLALAEKFKSSEMLTTSLRVRVVLRCARFGVYGAWPHFNEIVCCLFLLRTHRDLILRIVQRCEFHDHQLLAFTEEEIDKVDFQLFHQKLGCLEVEPPAPMVSFISSYPTTSPALIDITDEKEEENGDVDFAKNDCNKEDGEIENCVLVRNYGDVVDSNTSAVDAVSTGTSSGNEKDISTAVSGLKRFFTNLFFTIFRIIVNVTIMYFCVFAFLFLLLSVVSN